MTAEKRESLVPLIESANQVHLTIYLENQGDPADLRRQIRDSLVEAEATLAPALGSEDIELLVQPIKALLNDGRVLGQIRGNIGLFRTRTTFRALSVPVAIRRSCYVASTFHVKPLLRWIQSDSDFLLLGLETHSAYLYAGSQHSLRKIDSLPYPDSLAELFAKNEELTFQEHRTLRREAPKTFSWISDWIKEACPSARHRLFLAGRAPLMRHFLRSHSYPRVVREPMFPAFSEERVIEVAAWVRSLLRYEAGQALKQALLTFQVADERNITQRNIREIAKAVVQGKVKKLVIAENREVFGKLDPASGKLTISTFDRDHEDDDLLDDLAQRVLLSGGEVFIARKEQIPSGRPILAILTEDEEPNQTRAKVPAGSRRIRRSSI